VSGVRGGIEMLLLTQDSQAERAVAGVAKAHPTLAAPPTLCQDLKELAKRLEERTLPVALVDLGAQPMEFLSTLEPLVRRFSETRFVLLGNDFQSDVILEAMQIGARNCLEKAKLDNDLPAVLKRLLPDIKASVASAGGRIITVLGASGGCGATTVAINCAEELSEDSGKPSLLVDLDVSFGSLGTFLGVHGQYGIADVFGQRGAIDAQLVTSTATTYSPNLHVLLSPATVNFSNPAHLSFERLDQMLTACRQSYRSTVVDAPRASMDVAGTLAQASEMTLVVFELAVIDIRSARAILTALTDRGISSESLVPVANRYRKRNPMLSFEDAEKALGNFALRRISNDFESAMRSVNFGQPLSKVAPRSVLRRDVRDLVSVLATQTNNHIG
jgi:pilus assembly protein CpaE